MSPSIWSRLGIEPGSDRKAIRRAYARLVREVNPEDDPDGFKALREAYELALAQAGAAIYRSPQALEADVGPVEPAPPSDEPDAPVWPAALEPGDLPPPAAENGHAEAGIAPLGGGLDEALTRLGALLARGADAEHRELAEALKTILSSPGLEDLRTHDRVAVILAGQLASAIPWSDPLLDQAIACFGWDAEIGGASPRPDVEALLRRREELCEVYRLGDPDHRLHRGWKALTEPMAGTARMRWQAMSADVTYQVAELFRWSSYELPGLRYHFDPARAEWWSKRLSRPQMMFGTWLIAPLSAAAFCYLALEAGSDSAAIAVLAAGMPLSLALPFLYMALLRRVVKSWSQRQEPVPRWMTEGWLAAVPAAALAIALLPANGPGAFAAALLSSALALWVALVWASPPPAGNLKATLARNGKMLWGLPVLGLFVLHRLDEARALQWASLALAYAFIWVRAAPYLAHKLGHTVPRGRPFVALGLAAGLVALFLGLSFVMPGTSRPFFAALALVLGWIVIQPFWAVDEEENKFGLVLAWVALVVFFSATLPREPAQPARPTSYYELPDYQRSEPWPTSSPMPPPNGLERMANDRGQAPAFDPNGAENMRVDSRGRRAGEWPISPPLTVERPDPAVCPTPDGSETGPLPPRACGNPARWFVPSDYPAAALRRNEGGSTTALLSVDSEGAIAGCEVVASSGSEALDSATCRLLSQRGRFQPARDSSGAAVESRFRYTMEWRITR